MPTVTLHVPSYSAVGQTYANVSCTAVGWYYPDDSGTTTTGDSLNGSSTTISYDNTTWSWSFSSGGGSSVKEPTHTFTGLSIGTANRVSGTLTARATRTVKRTTWSTSRVQTGTDENGNPIYENVTTRTEHPATTTTVTIGTASDSVTVYTSPSPFSFGCSRGDYIADYITASRWNQLVDQLGKYRSWRNQSNNYSDYNTLKVAAGAWITATLYNSMAYNCGVARVTDSTIISATHFNDLADAVSP